MADTSAPAGAVLSAEVEFSADAFDRGMAFAVHEAVEKPDGTTVIFVGESVREVEFPPLNRPLPAYVTLAETVVEPASFIDYIIGYKSASAVCRASLSRNMITAVLDYHGRAREGDADAATPNHMAHTVALNCPFDLDYLKWKKAFAGPLDQRELAEFIEDMVFTIGDPPAADLLEAIADLKIDRAVKFKSARNERNGNISITYEEVDDDKVQGSVSLPPKLTVVVPIFQGGNPQQLDVRLRYRMDKGQIAFLLSVAGLDKIEREAFRSIGEKVRTDTNTPVFYVA